MKTKHPLEMPAPVLHDDGSLTLSLPIPARGISPNARRGESKWAAIAKSKEIRAHRFFAYAATRNAINTLLGGTLPTLVGYSLAHYFPTSAFRDDDNADAACKAYRDGIAHALDIDDRTLRKVKLSTFDKDAAAPRVEITLHTSLP
jgi:hypothetical protein